MTQKALSELFDCGVDNISIHLKNIYDEKELSEEATVEFFSIVQQEGNRKVTRRVKCYNLDAIIAVGYRVNSKKATRFRQWATKTLKEYINKTHKRQQKTGKMTVLLWNSMLYFYRKTKESQRLLCLFFFGEVLLCMRSAVCLESGRL